MLAHGRRLIGIMLPLGALTGLCVAFVLKALERFEPWVGPDAERIHLSLWLPAIGLFLTALLLNRTRIGEVSLSKDLDIARRNPYEAFPLWKSVIKLLGCAFTIGFGGSAGVEGPGKWFGSALGLQAHRSLKAMSGLHASGRRLLAPARVIVMAGSAAALASVFRAPLTGALMAAEHEGQLHPKAMVPCLVSSASGYLVFSAIMGLEPLLPMARAYHLQFGEILWALLLGVACGVAAALFIGAEAQMGRVLAPLSLLWRGCVAGLGLALLALPAHVFWHGAPVTQGGGLDLVVRLLRGDTTSSQAILFFALKLFATALTFAGGGIGGKWLPSITMGAAIGAAFDALLGLHQPGLMTLLGASAMAGAVHQSLLIPVVFLAETTAQAALVVPALLGTTVAYILAQERSRFRKPVTRPAKPKD
jgi:CIC family chloride channel protein